MARRWQAKIVALVSASAKAHAVEIDLLGEKVRSNPATGVRFVAVLFFPGLPTRHRFDPVSNADDVINGLPGSSHLASPQRAPRADRRAPQRLAGDRIGAHPEEVEQMLLADLRADLDPRSPIKAGQASAEEHARRRTGRGVVVGQTHRLMAHPVAGRHRLHQVPIPRPQRHPAD